MTMQVEKRKPGRPLGSGKKPEVVEVDHGPVFHALVRSAPAYVPRYKVILSTAEPILLPSNYSMFGLGQDCVLISVDMQKRLRLEPGDRVEIRFNKVEKVEKKPSFQPGNSEKGSIADATNGSVVEKDATETENGHGEEG